MKVKEIRCSGCDRLLAVVKNDAIEIKCKCKDYTLITERQQRQLEGLEPPARRVHAPKKLKKETVSSTGT